MTLLTGLTIRDAKPEPPHSYSASLREPFLLNVVHQCDVITELTSFAVENRIKTASLQMVSGTAELVHLYTGKPSNTPARSIATFSGPHEIESPAQLVTGSGVLGRDRQDENPSIHMHAVFCDRNGKLRGCHLAPELCIAATGGIEILVMPIHLGVFMRGEDPLTRFDIFFPKNRER